MVFPSLLPNPAIEIGMVGASVVNLEFLGGRWVVVDGGFQARRLTGNHALPPRGAGGGRGAAAHAPRILAGMGVRGILAPEGGCATPWRTVLLAEGDAAGQIAAWRDLAPRYREANEPNRFGWVVELDALDPTAVPVKRTALGALSEG
ncbi:MAG: DUF839 domain-containing protein [Acetobacteraceae bacterium]|nr:DUF839 domain-containing protein [Acetobacteraceae bacterium]